jgi:hypothetical protein
MKEACISMHLTGIFWMVHIRIGIGYREVNFSPVKGAAENIESSEYL